MTRTESKHEAFRRLATKRTNTVIERLRILGHCANPWQYEYSEEEIKKIFRAIDAELRVVKTKFRNSSKSEFQL